MLVQLDQGARSGAATADPVPEGAEVAGLRGARLADMRQVASLIDAFARRGLMLPKTSGQLCRHFREFVVAVDAQERVLGCVALRVYTADVAEVSALAVAEAAHGQGIGRGLVEALTAEAWDIGLRTLFALTLQEQFFHCLGFRTVSRELFPFKIAADCRSCPKRTDCREITVAKEIQSTIEREDSK